MATPQVTTRILRRLLASGVDTRAERLLARMPPADIAPLFSGLTRDEVATVVDLLFRQRRAARVLRELPSEMLPEIFEAITDERLARVLDRLEIDDLLGAVVRKGRANGVPVPASAALYATLYAFRNGPPP